MDYSSHRYYFVRRVSGVAARSMVPKNHYSVTPKVVHVCVCSLSSVLKLLLLTRLLLKYVWFLTCKAYSTTPSHANVVRFFATEKNIGKHIW